MKNKELTQYVYTFVQQLIASGVEEVVISPGSRSTPLALAIAEHPLLNAYINIDERSAGFFALGMAKRKQKPVALLCTSGTAAANYYPAVIEAHYARVPLIILTADRPHELRDVGAPQAINQIELYGKYVKWFTDAPIPEDRPKILHYIKRVVQRSVIEAMKFPKGPVHVNLPLRAPLVPDMEWLEENFTSEVGYSVHNYVPSQSVLNEETFRQLANYIGSINKGLIICGEMHDIQFSHSIVTFAEKIGFPILADPLSQLRYGNHSKDVIIENYDTILKGIEMDEALQPQLIIRFGAMPVSKPLWLYLQEQSQIVQWVVDHGGGWRDPSLAADEHFICSESAFCEKMSEMVEINTDKTFLRTWQQVNDIVKRNIESIPSSQQNGLFEGRVYVELQKMLPEKCNLVIGNSMPIRDVDTYFQSNNKHWRLFANRGANGIDGVVSTALGICASSSDPTFLIIGDLSFYHDLNGLLAGKMYDLSLTILLINNNGGGIFSFLPQSSEEKHFETLFGTPTDIDFEYASKMYGFEYRKVEDTNQLHKYLQEPSSGIRIIEIVTNRHGRVEIQRNFTQFVSQEIRKELNR